MRALRPNGALEALGTLSPDGPLKALRSLSADTALSTLGALGAGGPAPGSSLGPGGPLGPLRTGAAPTAGIARSTGHLFLYRDGDGKPGHTGQAQLELHLSQAGHVVHSAVVSGTVVVDPGGNRPGRRT